MLVWCGQHTLHRRLAYNQLNYISSSSDAIQGINILDGEQHSPEIYQW